MSKSESGGPVTASETHTPGKSLVIVLGTVACTVIGHALVTDWRPSPGGNPWLVPVIASGLMLLSAFVLAGAACRGATQRGNSSDTQGHGTASIAVATLVTACWGLGYFHAVQTLGLAAASWLFLVVGMLALSPEPTRALRLVLPLSAAIALAFWLMFTRLAPVVLGDPILW